MPEIPLCGCCGELIDCDTQDYVVPNKFDDEGRVRDESEWMYVHLECHKKILEARKKG